MSGETRTRRRDPRRANLIAGLAVLAILVVFGYVSYTSVNGLPLESTYDVSAELPSANRLVAKDDVRIGGTRVGRVARVRVVEGTPPHARVDLELEPDVGPLPADTRVKVRPSSALGATYVDLTLGDSDQTLAEGEVLPLRNSEAVVELTDLLDIFDDRTAAAVQDTFAGFGGGLAGRGPALNLMLGSLDELLPPAERVARAVAAPAADLAGFLRGYESFVAALEPVGDEFAQLLGNGATTLAAFERERDALAATIEALPDTERAVTSGFTRLQPALDGLAALTVDLRDGTEVLPRTLDEVHATLDAGVAPFRALPTLTEPLDDALAELRRTSGTQSATGVLRKARDAFRHSTFLLEYLTPAQISCNVISLWGMKFGNVMTVGGGGTQALANVGLASAGASGSIFQQSQPAKDLGVNYIPIENYQECESGNEPSPVLNGQQLEHHPGNQPLGVPETVMPPGVRELAAEAGLMDDGKGNR